MKRNWIFILLAACLAGTACTGRNASVKSGETAGPEVIIDYGRVEGYGVTVRLFPQNRVTDNACQAIIDLEHEGEHRLFLHNAFLDPDRADSLASGTVLKRKYELPEGAEARHLNMDIFSGMPFFFLDVDFDGEKELVLTLANQAQRWLNAYMPIHLDYDYLYDNLKEKPFTDLDDTSEIDYDKNTITLYAHNGAGSWASDVYVYQKLEEDMVSRPELISHTCTEYDTWNESAPKKRIITEKRDTTGWMPAKEVLEEK